MSIPIGAVREAASASPALQADMAAAERRRRAVMEERLVSLGQRNARARLAHLLCEVAYRTGLGTPNTSLTWPLTQADVGDVLGLSHVHVNRTLKTLRHDGKLTLSPGRLRLLDFGGLASIAGFSPDYLN